MFRPDRDLFTKVTDLDARGRGEFLGGILITVILLIVEAVPALPSQAWRWSSRRRVFCVC